MNAGRVILLQSFPRSGNTLFRHVLEDVYGVPTFTVYPNEGEAIWANRLVSDECVSCADIVFVKTHEEPENRELPTSVIYIVRDGRDTLLSYAHFLADFQPSLGDDWRERLEQIVNCEAEARGANSLSPALDWGAHVTQLLPKADVVVRFEKLLADPWYEVEQALDTLGLLRSMPLPAPNRLSRFRDLHAANPQFYRSGKVGEWKKAFPPDLIPQFWAHHREGMEVAGYAKEGIIA